MADPFEQIRSPRQKKDASTDWLPKALQELEATRDEAVEDEIELSEVAFENAKRMLQRLAVKTEDAPTVYPSEEGGIAIDWQNRTQKTGVLIICEPDGQGSVYAIYGEKGGRAHFQESSDALEFALAALAKSRVAS